MVVVVVVVVVVAVVVVAAVVTFGLRTIGLDTANSACRCFPMESAVNTGFTHLDNFACLLDSPCNQDSVLDTSTRSLSRSSSVIWE